MPVNESDRHVKSIVLRGFGRDGIKVRNIKLKYFYVENFMFEVPFKTGQGFADNTIQNVYFKHFSKELEEKQNIKSVL